MIIVSVHCGWGTVRAIWVFLLLLIPLWGIQTIASAQNAGHEGKPLIQTTSTFVLVPVRASSTVGEPVRQLNPELLRVMDDDVQQRAERVKTDDLPIALVILMQTGGAGRRQLASYFDLARLVDGILSHSGREVMFATFDSRIEETWHFPAQSDGLNWSLQHPHPGDDGAALMDAVSFGVRQLQAEPGRFRRVVLLLSQDVDQGSAISRKDLIEQLGVASTVVYSLTFPARKLKAGAEAGSGTTAKLLSPDLAKALRLLDRDTASEIAVLTGGDHMQFDGRRSFNSALLQVADDIRNTQLLGFQPSNHTPGFHTIRVESPMPGSREIIVARSAYWFGAAGGHD